MADFDPADVRRLWEAARAANPTRAIGQQALADALASFPAPDDWVRPSALYRALQGHDQGGGR